VRQNAHLEERLSLILTPAARHAECRSIVAEMDGCSIRWFMPNSAHDEKFMRSALVEARKGLGRTSPNPAVGAVLVIGHRVVSRGHHHGPGKPHAEIECLEAWKNPIPKAATLFVTLEPCSTTGRTGPCTDAIIRSGIKRVVVGTIDVNPRHQGRGISLLQQAGIEVRTGVLADDCARLNEHFNKWIVTSLPFVIAKCGMSLDGRLSRSPNEGRWLTSAGARRHAHGLRAEVDAILVGAETIRADDPRLTVRGIRGAKQPLRVVVTRSGKLPRKAKIFRGSARDRTVVYQGQPLRSVLADLGKRDVTSVLIEGGGQVLGEAFDHGLIDKVQIYVAPMFTGGPTVAFAGTGVSGTAEAARIGSIRFERVGPDLCVTGYPQFPQPPKEDSNSDAKRLDDP
jgi:diaminohydroxyphosphoribosylaminopyrimidine deaminase/5-amino-6-(5-phosphoribosylamino)uracil reductase